MGRKTSTIPKASVARILVKAGAKRVSQDGVDAFAEVLTDIALKISKKAADISKHAGRKTIHEGDVKLAAKN
ncbi:NFYB/HAP3 family transcription factor subunit [Candidatus Woesearchaeota archaeon]|nr:NFYB/HAP3 family transcription factor subunit [Candidatus Woesearchaeota archaeon]